MSANRPIVMALFLLAASMLAVSARADEVKLDDYVLETDTLPKEAVVVFKTLSTDNTFLGAGANPKKPKSVEIAETIKAVAPPTFTEAFVNRLKETGVFQDVVAFDGGEIPAGAIVIDGEFTEINPGSRAKRYLVGMGAGRSKICVKGRVLVAGEAAGTFEHCRSGALGWFGGRSEGMMSTDVYQTAFRVADFVAAWANGAVRKE